MGLALYFILRWLDDEEEWKEKERQFTMADFEKMMSKYIETGICFWYYSERAEYMKEFFWKFYGAEIDNLRTYAEKFVGFTRIDMMKALFGAKKLFYWDCEVGHIAAKVVRELGYCKYVCIHMG